MFILHKIWARSVQPFRRLSVTKKTDKKSIYYRFKEGEKDYLKEKRETLKRDTTSLLEHVGSTES